jgi:hypothetical protein
VSTKAWAIQSVITELCNGRWSHHIIVGMIFFWWLTGYRKKEVSTSDPPRTPISSHPLAIDEVQLQTWLEFMADPSIQNLDTEGIVALFVEFLAGLIPDLAAARRFAANWPKETYPRPPNPAHR